MGIGVAFVVAFNLAMMGWWMILIYNSRNQWGCTSNSRAARALAPVPAATALG
jgi:hypothetical protein